MPYYSFYNEKTNEYVEELMNMSDLDSFKKKHPHLKQQLSCPSIIAGVTIEGGKLPEGFKDRLREMKKKHPRSKGVDHII